jgi:hypothetical protein
VAYEVFLIQTVEAEPAITMPELAARLLEQHGVVVAPAMLSRFLCRRGFIYKESPHGGGARHPTAEAPVSLLQSSSAYTPDPALGPSIHASTDPARQFSQFA